MQEFQLAYLEKRGITYPKLEETYGLLRYAREMHVFFNNDVKEGDKVEIRTQVAKMGTTSFTIKQAIMNGSDTPAIDFEIKLVMVDKNTKRSTPLPEDVKRKLLMDVSTPVQPH